MPGSTFTYSPDVTDKNNSSPSLIPPSVSTSLTKPKVQIYPKEFDSIVWVAKPATCEFCSESAEAKTIVGAAPPCDPLILTTEPFSISLGVLFLTLTYSSCPICSDISASSLYNVRV